MFFTTDPADMRTGLGPFPGLILWEVFYLHVTYERHVQPLQVRLSDFLFTVYHGERRRLILNLPELMQK